MKHERPDYARIQDPAANDELVHAFVHAQWLLAEGENTGAPPSAAQLKRGLAGLVRHLEPTIAPIIDAGPANPIAADEPVFLLRARDKTAPYILREYARHLRQNGAGWEEHNRIVAQAKAMEEWATENGAKLPDAPAATQQEQSHA